MSARKAWTSLSPAYRARLERAGVTASTHASADKTRARGHPSPLPTGSVQPELINRVVSGEGTVEELNTLASRFTRPSWIPERYSVDVAAALSQLPNPRTWSSVEFVPAADDQPWTMIVHRKGNAYDRTILIPGGGGDGSGAREVLELVTDLSRESEAQRNARRRRREIEALFFEVLGTDEETE